MELDDTFRMDVPIDEAWRILSAIERVAACLPGTELHEVKGDEYRGAVEVKIGALTVQYQGTVRVESVDAAAHTAIIVGTGRDTHGQGNASATIEVTLLAEGAGTRVDLDTDLSLTGKVAQFGRGVVADVSAKLLAEFVENLERDLLSPEIVDLSASEAAESASVAPAAPAAPAPESGSGDAPAVRKAEIVGAAPAELLEPGGTAVLRRVAPLVGVVVAAVVVRRLLRRRHRGTGSAP